jgi:pyrroline-5-carboxylate reductase
LGVKPYLMADMLEKIQPFLAQARPVLITMAAGLTMERIREMAGGDYPVIRIMPNTPSAIGEGMIQYCTLDVTTEQEEEFLQAMSECGRMDKIPENLIDAASAVSGCGPAFAYMFIEALADGGVACGLPRAKAMEYAAQMLQGSARLAMQSENHPGALKDAVCSPGGSTIQGVRKLEQYAFRAAVTDAVIAAFEKNLEMKKM